MVKGAADRALSIGLVSLGHFVPALPFFLILPAPDMAALPYIVASTVIHWGYYFFLIAAYKNSDLSVAYPIARGAAPVLIALGATIWPGEILSLMAWGGIIGVSCAPGRIPRHRCGYKSPVSRLHHRFNGGGLFNRGWDWGARFRRAFIIYNMAFYRRNLCHSIRANASACLDQAKWCKTIFDGIFRRGSFKPVLCFGGFCANLSAFGFGRRDPRNIGYFGGAYRGHLV